jgi:hypothetical protein
MERRRPGAALPHVGELLSNSLYTLYRVTRDRHDRAPTPAHLVAASTWDAAGYSVKHRVRTHLVSIEQ